MPDVLQTRWPDVERVLDAVLDRPTHEWAAAVESECAGDPALRRSVESLLAHANQLDGYLEGPAARVTALLREAREEPGRTGEVLGAWRLAEEVGRGGMGVVYRAERADGLYEQAAAVKLLRAGAEAAGAIRRFALERRVLASLDHPGIARLLDGGAAPDGQPFLVMEFVEGEPLDAYCDRRGLGVEARLALFLDVCDAVAHAHRHLVVHRDLKPSNVLVADGDKGPRVKLLDFGIAKLLESDGGAQVTQAARRAFTPAYAAPEQVEGRAVTTATDVYGLGVVLFELLTGRRPFQEDPAAPRALERAVLEAEAPRPSASVDAAAAARGTATERLRARLAGDLDAVVARSLRKEPEARYATADALAADLRRHLDGLPVEARRGATGYRVRKFVGRHRVGVAAAAATLVLLAGATTALALQASRLERALTAARVEQERAEAVSDFLTGLFSGADALEGGSEDVTAGELLTQGLATADSALAGQPVAHAAVLRAIGMSLVGLSRFEEAVAPMGRALAILERAYGPHHRDVADARYAYGYALRMQGAGDEAEAALEAAARTARTLEPVDSTLLANALLQLAFVRLEVNRVTEAIPLLQEGLRYADDEQEALGLGGLAGAMEQSGRYEEAVAAARRALALGLRVHGPDNIPTLAAMGDLAGYLEYVGAREESERLHRANVAGLRRLAVGRDDFDLFWSVNSLGRFLTGQPEDYEEAEALLRENLARVRRMFTGPSDLVGVGCVSLATLLSRTGGPGDLAEAEALFREALAIYGETLPPRHPRLSGVISGLGWVRIVQRRYPEAEAFYRESLALAPADDDRALSAANGGLGEALTGQGRYAEAEPLLIESLRAFERVHSSATGRGRARLVRLYEAWGRPDVAARYR